MADLHKKTSNNLISSANLIILLLLMKKKNLFLLATIIRFNKIGLELLIYKSIITSRLNNNCIDKFILLFLSKIKRKSNMGTFQVINLIQT